MSIKVILKLDDLQSLSDNVLRFDRICEKYDLKATWGIIGKALKNADPLYINWIKKHNGRYEFWNHGYNHDCEPYEFERSFLSQVFSIKRTQTLSRKLLKFDLIGFGAPANHINKITALALLCFPKIKYWFFGKGIGKHCFERSVEIEFPCGNVNFEKFKYAYEKWGQNRNLLIYQCHPNMWSNHDFEQFEYIIEFMKQHDFEFVLPKDVLISAKKDNQ